MGPLLDKVRGYRQSELHEIHSSELQKSEHHVDQSQPSMRRDTAKPQNLELKTPRQKLGFKGAEIRTEFLCKQSIILAVRVAPLQNGH